MDSIDDIASNTEKQQLKDAIGQAGWSIGTISEGAGSVAYTFCPWPDTWSVDGPHAFTASGKDDVEALRNVLAIIEERQAAADKE